MVQLDALLAAMGLPAQTVGVASIAARQPAKVLTDAELADCAKLVTSIRKQGEKVGQPAKALFERNRTSRDDDKLNPQDFVNILRQAYGDNFLKLLRLESNIDNLVLYLAEKAPTSTISHRKLALALARTEKDPPLKQGGIDDLLRYTAGIRDQITAASAENEVGLLADHLAAQQRHITDLLPSGVKGQVTTLPKD